MVYNVVRSPSSFIHLSTRKEHKDRRCNSRANHGFVCLVQVSLVDAMGTRFTKDGKIVGLDPDNDLAVLKVILRQYDVEHIFRPFESHTFMYCHF